MAPKTQSPQHYLVPVAADDRTGHEVLGVPAGKLRGGVVGRDRFEGSDKCGQ